MTRGDSSTTTCATITGGGRSAIAVIAIRGSDAADIVSRCFEGATKARFSPSEIRYGVWTGPLNQELAAESVVVTPLTDDHYEIHCHGGLAAAARIIEDMSAAGARPIEADGWSRASQNLLSHEAQQVLMRCVTSRTAAIAMDQVRGAMSNWATDLLRDVENHEKSIGAAKRDAAEILASAHFTARLDEPFRVVLVGPPNVGKSSLLNAIVGFNRSITFDAAGTTRDVLHADTVIDGLPIRLSDTAGVRDSDQPIEKQGIERARAAAHDADLVLHVRQPDLPRQPIGDPVLLSSPERVIFVLNKVDLLENHDPTDARELATNALTGEGVGELMTAIADALAEPTRKGAPAAINARQADLLGKIVVSEDKDHVSAKLRMLLGVNV
jgi:tRNA modification GTPase